jgi:glycerol kinase
LSKKYILTIDEGTTGSTVLIVDHDGQIISRAYSEFTQYYPQPGWVEHDATEIWDVTLRVAREAMARASISAHDIKAVGITNQRETTVVWDRATGEPVTRAIVWQCRRTASLCEEMKQAGMAKMVRDRTGLVIDAYFSATKLAWILDNVPEARLKAEAGDLLFGTIDTWLVWKLTGGRVHVTDYSNASRTMLFNIHELRWDRELLDYFAIPEGVLPQAAESSAIYGLTDPQLLGAEIPIGGMAGDQQAALFGQACFTPGSAKNTYGTGCFLLMNTGDQPIMSERGLLTTIAWGLDGKACYALEGAVFIAGAAVQWLRDEMKLVVDAVESEAVATSVADNAGVYMVPAFVGLGAPYWDMYARGMVVGLTRGTGRAHLVRAVLESIAYQTHDVLNAMKDDGHMRLESLKVDGGAAANNFLMQFQADVLGAPVERPLQTDSTAVGATYLAGLSTGFWKDQDELRGIRRVERRFTPQMEASEREHLLAGWKRAVKCALTYGE